MGCPSEKNHPTLRKTIDTYPTSVALPNPSNQLVSTP